MLTEGGCHMTKRLFSILTATVIFTSLSITPAYSQLFEGYDSTPLQLAIWNPVQLAPEDIDVLGLRLNLLCGENRDVYGIDAGLINSLTRDMIGIQGGLMNINRGEMIGIQIGLDNIVGKLPPLGGTYRTSTPKTIGACGIQLGAINAVYPRGMMSGIPAGIINVADKIHGLQIGIINCANDMTGIQIGLLNYNDSAEFYLSPIINACF